MIDLIASVIAFVAVRRADEPADEDHPYGHEKMESVAASIEGMLILVGAGIIIYRVGAPARDRGRGRGPRRRHRGDRLLGGRQRRRRRPSCAARPASTTPRPWPATPRTSGPTRSPRVGVLIGLVLVEVTGAVAIDSAVAIVVAVVIVFAGVRIMRRASGALVDESPPPEEMDRIEAAIAGRPPAGDGRLPQAPRPHRRQPPLHRHARPVQDRHHPGARPLARPHPARRDRGRAEETPRS